MLVAELSKLYAENSNFLGFYGTQFEELTYNIQIAAYNIDLYAVGDLVSYDEKLGVDVAYDRGNIHSASRNSGVTSYTTISRHSLPIVPHPHGTYAYRGNPSANQMPYNVHNSKACHHDIHNS